MEDIRYLCEKYFKYYRYEFEEKRFAVCFFLLAVALTFLMGKGDNLWLISWGDLIPSLFVLFIAGDCLHSSLLRIKRGEEAGGSRWSTCFAFLIFSIVFMGDLFFIGHFIIDKLLG
mgnify:CR=1 FL=1